jgi:hypothetical protein
MLYKFADFVNESYLDGGRQPLYHSTHYFINILIVINSKYPNLHSMLIDESTRYQEVEHFQVKIVYVKC